MPVEGIVLPPVIELVLDAVAHFNPATRRHRHVSAIKERMQIELFELGFDRVAPRWTGRPGYHPSALLKLYIYGYLNRVHRFVHDSSG